MVATAAVRSCPTPFRLRPAFPRLFAFDSAAHGGLGRVPCECRCIAEVAPSAPGESRVRSAADASVHAQNLVLFEPIDLAERRPGRPRDPKPPHRMGRC